MRKLNLGNEIKITGKCCRVYAQSAEMVLEVEDGINCITFSCLLDESHQRAINQRGIVGQNVSVRGAVIPDVLGKMADYATVSVSELILLGDD